jgi:DNA-directed RNA polymerase subunit RPC12/RpoP
MAKDKRSLSKEEMRAETERLVREALEKKGLTITHADTRIEAVCGKCGAPNRIKMPKGESRVEFKCKECGHKQKTL